MNEERRESSSNYLRRGPEARIALCHCKESRKIYGVRMEKSQEGWDCTWAFPISKKVASHEGYDSTVLKGNIGWKSDYNGCPYCGTKPFVVCDVCMKLNCKIIKGDEFTCGWCGSTGRLVDYDGTGVQSGGDRA